MLLVRVRVPLLRRRRRNSTAITRDRAVGQSQGAAVGHAAAVVAPLPETVLWVRVSRTAVEHAAVRTRRAPLPETVLLVRVRVPLLNTPSPARE